MVIFFFKNIDLMANWLLLNKYVEIYILNPRSLQRCQSHTTSFVIVHVTIYLLITNFPSHD